MLLLAGRSFRLLFSKLTAATLTALLSLLESQEARNLRHLIVAGNIAELIPHSASSSTLSTAFWSVSSKVVTSHQKPSTRPKHSVSPQMPNDDTSDA